MAGKLKSKRNIYLIDPKFQLKTSLFISTLVFLGSTLYPYTIYLTFAEIVNIINDPEIAAKLNDRKAQIIFFLVISHLAFSAFTFIICIYQSHKIAGPLFKLKKFLEGIRQGNKPSHLFFRKGDHFQDLADTFNEAFSKISEGKVAIAKEIDQLNNSLSEITSRVSDKDKSSLLEIRNKLQVLAEKAKED